MTARGSVNSVKMQATVLSRQGENRRQTQPHGHKPSHVMGAARPLSRWPAGGGQCHLQGPGAAEPQTGFLGSPETTLGQVSESDLPGRLADTSLASCPMLPPVTSVQNAQCAHRRGVAGKALPGPRCRPHRLLTHKTVFGSGDVSIQGGSCRPSASPCPWAIALSLFSFSLCCTVMWVVTGGQSP